ncbi:MAG: hypothetical protein J2P15_09800 [Micromonosporaceae bacterium]|nr:hypothetical protein [Micromonosporaceae bacterium]
MLGRRRRLPAERRPPLDRDERIVAWAQAPGGLLVATNLGLWLPGGDRLGWARVHKAVWSGSDLVITSAEVVTSIDGYEVVADQAPVRYPLADPGDVPHQVRTRVTRSVAYTAHHPLPGAGGVRIAARRVPGADGLRWTVRYDAGTDRDDPVVREATDQLVAQARDAVET